MKKYEVIYILSGKLNKDELIKEVDKHNVFLEKNGVKINQKNISELKDFAYLIKKQSNGYYVILNVEVEERKQLNEFEHSLKFDNNVLRFLVLTDKQ